jgi:hypothetical protein
MILEVHSQFLGASERVVEGLRDLVGKNALPLFGVVRIESNNISRLQND